MLGDQSVPGPAEDPNRVVPVLALGPVVVADEGVEVRAVEDPSDPRGLRGRLAEESVVIRRLSTTNLDALRRELVDPPIGRRGEFVEAQPGGGVTVCR